MAQTKLRSTRPFGSPTADDDDQGLYHFGYYCEFPTHLHKTLRLTSAWHSGVGTDFGLLEWPGLKLNVNFYIWDGMLIRWWAEHPIFPGVFRLYRRCTRDPYEYWYYFQHYTLGILDGTAGNNLVAFCFQSGNHEIGHKQKIITGPWLKIAPGKGLTAPDLTRNSGMARQ